MFQIWPVFLPRQKNELILVSFLLKNLFHLLLVLESDLYKVYAVSPAFIKLLTLTIKCAKEHFIEWVCGDVLHKNNSVWVLALDVGMELINQKFRTFARNLGRYFDLSKLKFDFFNHRLQLLFKVGPGVEDVGLRLKPYDSSLFINKNLISVDKILQGAART